MTRLERKAQVEAVLLHGFLWVICPLLHIPAMWYAATAGFPRTALYWVCCVVAFLTVFQTVLVGLMLPVLAFVALGTLWDWAWEPRGTAPGAPVKFVPYKPRNDAGDKQ